MYSPAWTTRPPPILHLFATLPILFQSPGYLPTGEVSGGISRGPPHSALFETKGPSRRLQAVSSFFWSMPVQQVPLTVTLAASASSGRRMGVVTN